MTNSINLRRHLAVLCVATLAGCGGPLPEGAHVTGKVTLDGVPIPTATIVFRPMEHATGKSSECRVVKGQFDVRQESGVFGAHRVEIYAHRADGQAPPAAPQPLPPGQLPPGTGLQYLPERYNRQSILTYNIQPGENEAKFELSSQSR